MSWTTFRKCDIVTKKKAAKIEGEKVKRFLNNLKFKSKILFIVGALFFVTATVGGIRIIIMQRRMWKKILRQVLKMF